MAKAPKPKRPPQPEHVCQFLVVLAATDPLVWRRIQESPDLKVGESSANRHNLRCASSPSVSQ